MPLTWNPVEICRGLLNVLTTAVCQKKDPLQNQLPEAPILEMGLPTPAEVRWMAETVPQASS